MSSCLRYYLLMTCKCRGFKYRDFVLIYYKNIDLNTLSIISTPISIHNKSNYSILRSDYQKYLRAHAQIINTAEIKGSSARCQRCAASSLTFRFMIKQNSSWKEWHHWLDQSDCNHESTLYRVNPEPVFQSNLTIFIISKHFTEFTMHILAKLLINSKEFKYI